MKFSNTITEHEISRIISKMIKTVYHGGSGNVHSVFTWDIRESR